MLIMKRFIEAAFNLAQVWARIAAGAVCDVLCQGIFLY